MRACNHPVQDDPTKFCVYRYRARREAGDAREGAPARAAARDEAARIASR
ncbi:hypothetical protein L810_6233 [Burkholderia sp. AU4i]|nr:hypothetical protein L810_6233 [Burkholderia sp. AU4i]